MFSATDAGLIVFLLALTTDGASIVSIGGNDGVTINNGVIRCGELECPHSAVGCIFNKRNNPLNESMVDVTQQCTDGLGKVITEKNYQFEARPGENYNSYVNIGTGGLSSNNIVIANDASNLDPAIKEKIQQDIDKAMQQLNKSMENLENMFKQPFFTNFGVWGP